MSELAKSLPKMQARPADLPDFEQPPLIEVVLGVQFAELRTYKAVHAGLLWESKFRSDFPECQERMPIDPAFEIFGPQKPGQVRLHVETRTSPTVPRVWFINADETELIQVQRDRFLHNWRRRKDNSEYPRYERIRERFFLEIKEVQSFLNQEKIGAIEPNQCEVTYVNHIELPTGEDPRSQLHRIFTAFRSPADLKDSTGARLTELEDARLGMRFVIRDPKNGEPRGRLHIQADPALRDDKPVIRFDLTARGAPKQPTLDGVAEFLDLGREALVRGFAAATSREMHDYWGRIK